jgi:hypothetical protein
MVWHGQDFSVVDVDAILFRILLLAGGLFPCGEDLSYLVYPQNRFSEDPKSGFIALQRTKKLGIIRGMD